MLLPFPVKLLRQDKREKELRKLGAHFSLVEGNVICPGHANLGEKSKLKRDAL